MRLPRPPIFLLDGHDLSVYDSVDAACRDLEIYDVQDQNIESFDSDGFPMQWRALGYRVVGGSLIEGRTSMADAVLGRVRSYARGLGPAALSPIDVETADLATLGNALLAHRPEPLGLRALLTERLRRRR